MEVDIQPTSRELMAIIGLLLVENDSLRGQLGSVVVHFVRRTFTNEDLVRGAAVSPTAKLTHGGSIVIAFES